MLLRCSNSPRPVLTSPVTTAAAMSEATIAAAPCIFGEGAGHNGMLNGIVTSDSNL